MPKLTAQQHLANNQAQIVKEAHEYAKTYNCPFEEAIRDVRDEYLQGLCESEEADRTTDQDYGRE